MIKFQTQPTTSSKGNAGNASITVAKSGGSTSGTTSTASANANGTTAANASSGVAQAKPELKPVECNLCHRKFKNIPALNGHMRLHGGYFKKVN